MGKLLWEIEKELYDRVSQKFSSNEPQHVASAYAKLLKYEKLTTSAAVVAVADVVVADAVAVATVAAAAAVGTSDAVDLICDLQQVSINKEPLKMRPYQPPRSTATPSTYLLLCLREGYIDLDGRFASAWGLL